MKYLRTKQFDVGTLDAYPGNARVHDDAALDESTATNGQYRSIVAREMPDGRAQILAGHGTLAALTRGGAAKVRVELITADDTEARRIVLADNGTSRSASYDEPLLLELLDAASQDGGLTGTGWDSDALTALLDSQATDFAPDGDTDPDGDDVEPPAEPVTRSGDVWVLGRHRLVCGDSMDAGVWRRLLGVDRVGCVWTDPPYGVAYVGKTTDALTIQNDALDEVGLDVLLRAALGHALEACTAGAAWYVAAPPGPLHLIFGKILTEWCVYRQPIVWVKDQFVMGHSDYHYRHEPIFYGWKPGGPHHALSDRTQDTVWEIPRPRRSTEHPTMKPVELVTRALVNSTNVGAVVADPFGGSGTTLIAADMTGRVARLIELDPRYCDVIARRYQALTGDLPILERTGERWDFTAVPPCVAA